MQAVGSISAIGRGKHTTRTVTLLPLLSGGLIADTPGFNQPALDAVTTEELPTSFPEIAARLEHDRCAPLQCLSLLSLSTNRPHAGIRSAGDGRGPNGGAAR